MCCKKSIFKTFLHVNTYSFSLIWLKQMLKCQKIISVSKWHVKHGLLVKIHNMRSFQNWSIFCYIKQFFLICKFMLTAFSVPIVMTSKSLTVNLLIVKVKLGEKWFNKFIAFRVNETDRYLFWVGAVRLYTYLKLAVFGLNIGLKSHFVVTQLPQKWRPKGKITHSSHDFY